MIAASRGCPPLTRGRQHPLLLVSRSLSLQELEALYHQERHSSLFVLLDETNVASVRHQVLRQGFDQSHPHGVMCLLTHRRRHLSPPFGMAWVHAVLSTRARHLSVSSPLFFFLLFRSAEPAGCSAISYGAGPVIRTW